MTDTQRRIKEYKAKLPGLKERVIAVALLLAMSFSMVVSASFAWYTLSQAPEVSLVNTTVAANGNLEIALAQTTYGYLEDENGDFLLDEHGNRIQGPVVEEPPESAIGDSSASEGGTLVGSNVKWGNLINLSDSAYGLEHISLRPALLSGYNLTKTPLYGATYSIDGRVQDVSEKYEYASWKDDGTGEFYFAAGDESTYGVRAIASVKYENITGNAVAKAMWNKIDNARTNVTTLYTNVITGKTLVDETKKVTCMQALTTLIELFVQDKANSVLGSGSPANYSGVVTYTYRLIEKFWEIIEAEGEFLLYMANLQAYLNDNSRGTETFKTIDELLSYDDQTLLNEYGVRLVSLKTYKTSRADIKYALTQTELPSLAIACDPDTVEESNRPVVSWSQIEPAVRRLVNINTALLDDMEIGKLSSNDMSSLIGIITSNNEKNPSTVIIKDGVLADTEQRIGAFLDEKDVMVSIHINVKYIITVNKDVYALVMTDASGDIDSTIDYEYTASLENTGTGGDAVAKDTYGMAIDFWTRTNVEGTTLTLEGNIEYRTEDAKITNKKGEETNLYSMTDPDNAMIDVYSMEEESVDEQGNVITDSDGKPVMVTNWYNASTHTRIGTDAELREANYSFSQQTIDIVEGFYGENRIWEDWQAQVDAGYIHEDSTTQGAGSCYIFYADNPTDQTRILNLLKAFTIAFLDQEGKNIATARLDTDNAYAINGKVTVPMKMVKGVTYTDADGKDKTGITELNANEAKLITAVVYLDGSSLSNENVLAAGEIEGRLNIQFGSSLDLTAGENKELQAKYREITAVATDGTSTSYGKDDAISYEYDGKEKEITVTLNITGDKPVNVSGFFVKTISATQGARTDSEKFTENADGTWSATFKLTKPGDYTFTSVITDGVEYILDVTPTVSISGLSISNLYSTYGSGMIMTADTSLAVPVSVNIDADENLQPSQVRALFVGKKNTPSEGVEYTAIMTFDSTTKKWSGTANIASSGTFDLKYLVMDGEYTDLEEMYGECPVTLITYLGLTARVWCTGREPMHDDDISLTDFKHTEKATIGMRVRIVDDMGNDIPDLTGVHLYYHSSGSPLDQDGMHSAMTWNVATKYYEGNLEMANPGIYSFDRLEVITTSSTGDGFSEIEKSTNAPVFTAISPEPPSYDSHETEKYQFVPKGDAVMSVNLRYANAATIWAVIRNTKTGQEELVPLPEDNEYKNPIDAEQNLYEYNFPVPKNVGGDYRDKQDGEWQITKICLQNVYVDGVMYSKDTDIGITIDNYSEEVVLNANTTETRTRCYVMDVSNEDIETYVVQTVKVKVTDASGSEYTGEVFGKDAEENVTGTFMQENTSKALTFTITDWSGNTITDISETELTWAIDYKGNSSEYGRYTGAVPYNFAPKITAKKDSEGNNTGVFTVEGQKYQFAGNYTTKLTYSYNGTEYTLIDIGKIGYEVWSKAPTVKVTSVGLENSRANRINISSIENNTFTTDSPSFINGVFNKVIDDYNAIVYQHSLPENNVLGSDLNRHSITRSTVTLTLSGVPSDITTASMIFPNAASSTYDAKFNFDTNSMEAMTYVGGAIAGEIKLLGGDVRAQIFLAGKQSVKTITIEYGGVTYTVELSHEVTINNTHYPPYATFGSTANGQTLPTAPSTIYSTPSANGTFTVILPGSQTWIENKTTTTNGTFVEQSKTTRDVYTETTTGSGCDKKTTYQPYTETTTVSVAESSTTTWTRTWTLIGWKVGNTTYDVGETISIEGHQSFTPVISYSDGTKNTESSTTTRTVIDYATNGQETTTKPGGSKVTSVEGSSKDVVSK